MTMSFDDVMNVMGAIMDAADCLIIGVGTENQEDDPAMWNEWHFIPSHGDDDEFLCDVSGVLESARIADEEEEWNHYHGLVDQDTLIAGIHRISHG